MSAGDSQAQGGHKPWGCQGTGGVQVPPPCSAAPLRAPDCPWVTPQHCVPRTGGVSLQCHTCLMGSDMGGCRTGQQGP